MSDTAAVSLPNGDYAIVEQLGHRTFVGRVEEIERFGTKMLQIEPVFSGALLDAVLIGGSTIFQFTPCSAEIAAKRAPTKLYQLPPSVAAVIPPAMLPAPAPADDEEEAEFAPAFLDDD